MKVRQASKIITNIIRNNKDISYCRQYKKYIDKSSIYNTVKTGMPLDTFMPYQLSKAVSTVSKHIDGCNKCYNKYKELIAYFTFGVKIDSAVVTHDVISTVAPENK